MTLTPQETMVTDKEAIKKPVEAPLTGNEVVISGMSGIFPKSDSIQQFKENLYNKVDMVTSEDPRWDSNHPEIPKYIGKVNGMGKFDAQFFRVHYKQACNMEPMSRKLLEHTYSAIYDSGINPQQLRGKKVGVFIGSTFSESEKKVIYENIQRNGFGISGCNKAMYANRISYWIDGKGPSYTLDLACASSMACVEHAYRSISSGQCEVAIVGGCNLCMHPNFTLNYKRAGFLCMDGKTKCFDKNGDGYARSDVIGVIFLQKAKDAKRIYSEVYYAKTNFSAKIDGQFLPIREPIEIQQFFEAFYSEINVSPKDVEYVEACGAAIAEADGNELEAIGNVFAKEKPIKVGCVKSNMGSSESGSGLCAVIKTCLAYHDGKLPGNLHYSEPQDHIPAVRDRRIEVLTDQTKFNRGFAALNTFSYSGANIHVLLKGHYKQKDLERYKSSIPHLVLVSGRQDSCVKTVLDMLSISPIDPEQIALLHGIHEVDIPGHMSRGYTLLENNTNKEPVCVGKSVEYYPGTTRPVCFVYSGMGSQWAGMGTELMRIPVFSAAIKKCHRVLESKGIDIVRILTEPDRKIYDNILHSFVGIAAVQIGLTDILTEIGVVPDYIIGHSVGELGCAYADGCFTAKQMILSAYSRGLVSLQTPFIRGSMAAVGLGYKTVLDLCPPEIEVACHNSSDSSTISGPAGIMKKFVSELTERDIFAKEVPCSNIAYHSRYIADAGPGLLKYLSEVIKDPKPRSIKWLSTSVPSEKWEEPMAKYCSAEYHTNNLLNSVLFEETSKLVPENALVIEIAPHGLLQAILKRSLSECVHIPLTRRGHADPVNFLLQAFGKMYQAGLNPNVNILYPKIEFPVATGTPFLSHLVQWEHSENWPEAIHNSKNRVTTIGRDFVMSIYDDDYKYFGGYLRDGACVFPEAAFLVLIWETLAMYKGVDYKKLSVIFRDVQFYSEAIIKTDRPLRLGIMIHKGNNKFEVSYENTMIVSGLVNATNGLESIQRNLPKPPANDNKIILSVKDVYTIMHLRGFSYKDKFQTIQSSNINRNQASIKWTDDWIPFLDSLIQFNTFARSNDGISTPTVIKKLAIDIKVHQKATQFTGDDVACIDAYLYNIYDYTRCGGVELDGIIFADRPILEKESDVLQVHTFVPFFPTENIELKSAIQTNLQIVAENLLNNKIKVFESLSTTSSNVSNVIKEAVSEVPTADFIVDTLENNNINAVKKCNLFIVEHLLEDEKKIKDLYAMLSNDTFVLTLEQDCTELQAKCKLFNVITTTFTTVEKIILILLKKSVNVFDENVTYLPINQDRQFSWIPHLQTELGKSARVVLVSERQPLCGLLGMVKKLRNEYGNKIGLVIVDAYDVPSFNPGYGLFTNQLQNNLAINVLKEGKWGGYYYIPIAKKSKLLQGVCLTITEPGNLDSLKWVETPPTTANSTLVKVCYAGPSLKDVQKAAGDVTEHNEKAFGMNFSGIDNRGKKVMGLVSGGAIANTVEADPDLLWPIPEHWTLEDAATVPLPYVQAFYCLGLKYGLTKGKTVFVSGGAGAFGQAVISICLALNCIVYTTVSDAHKKQLLLRLFPKLDENNIEYTRPTFQDLVITKSKSKKCDLVINCASGPSRKAAMKCVGCISTFMDVGDYDMTRNTDFGINFLVEAKTYKAINLSTIFKPKYVKEKRILQRMLSEGIASGIVRPITRIVYSPGNVSRAFRLLSNSKHRGNVLIRMNDPESQGKQTNVMQRVSYCPKGSYIVVCDETVLGIELVDRLVKGGAKKVVIHLKPNSIAGYCYSKIVAWKKLNVSLKISNENLQTQKGCMNLFEEATQLGPILGVFIVQNFNVEVTEDNLTPGNYAAKFNKTVLVVANLDILCRNMCNELNYFVVLNYSSKNVSDEYMISVTDKICQVRNDLTLPALVFRVGFLKELENISESMESKMQPQSVSAVFNALETCLKLKHTNVISFNVRKNGNLDFKHRIARIIGVKNIEDIAETYTLQDLNMSNININEIKMAIKDAYQVNYPNEKVQQMTIASFKKLYQNVNKNTSFDSGLGAFFTYIDKDECLATEPLITMPTTFSSVQREDEIDPKATYLMLIPGFEGHHQIFKPVCERLKVQALTFQITSEEYNESIHGIGNSIKKFMKNRFKLESKFYLMGYSFGVNVALELAALFEKEGHVGVVYCLDSSPDALRAQLAAYVGNLTDGELQNCIIEHMYRLMTGEDNEDLKQDLKRLENWSEKVDACVNKLRGLVNYSHQYKRSILNGAYKKIMLAREYEPNLKLESEIVLIKGIPHPKSEQLADDYNLSKFTKQPVKVFHIDSDNALAPQDCKVSNIVNKLLEPKLLEEFKKKSLCETYLANLSKAW